MNFKTLATSALFIAFIAGAEEPVPASDRALLEKLRADDFDERQAAREKLVARGDAVRSLIASELAKTGLDTDYKLNLNTIATELNENANLNPFDAPKRLDLELKNETVGVALQKISTSFGQTVTAREGAGSKTVTLSLNQKTFMESVDAVRRAAGLSFFPPAPVDPYFPDTQATLDRFKNLALSLPSKDAEDIVATNGPFAVALSHPRTSDEPEFQSRDKASSIGGTLYFTQGARFSGAKIIALNGTDGKMEFDELARAKNFRFQKLWSGRTADSGSFLCGFYSVPLRIVKIPSGLKWTMKLSVDVPLTHTEDLIELDPEQFKIPQSRSIGTFTIHSVTESRGVWTVDCGMPAALYTFTRQQLNTLVLDGPPFRSPYLFPDLCVLDENRKQLNWRSTHTSMDEEVTGRVCRMVLQVDAKPKSIAFGKTTRTATREFEFVFPVQRPAEK